MPVAIIPSSFPIGTPFGRLTTTTLPYRKQHSYGAKWHVVCRCSCGNTKEYVLSPIRRGDTRSCGCLKSEQSRDRCIARRIYYSNTDIKLHKIFRGMKRRCYEPKHKYFYRYGGRGIRICEAWLNSFAVFREWAVNHPAYREGLTIERKDNDKDYMPENCTWIPREEQPFNCSRTRYFEYQGERKRLSQWAEDPRCLASSLTSLYERLERGLTFEAALTMPAISQGYGNAKVTEDQVREIRSAYAAGILQRVIAKEHQISRQNVSAIVNRKAWEHVE
jgi:hypothetical protein